MTEVLHRPPNPDRSRVEQKSDRDTSAAQEVPKVAVTAMSPVPLSELLTRKERRKRDREARRSKPG